MAVEDIIDDSRAYVSNSMQGANQFIQTLRDAARAGFSFTPFQVLTPWMRDPLYTTDVNFSAPPTIAVPDVSVLEPGDAPAPTVRELADVVIPDFSGVMPSLSFPLRPNAALPPAPGAAPEFNAPAIPSRPAIALPSVPTLATIEIPAPPSLEIPTFDMAAPFTELNPPTSSFTWSETPYTSDLLDSARALLKADIENGGYGLDPRDEARLWEREKDRQLGNAEAEMAEVDRLLSARGFTMPTGTHLAALQAAGQKVQAALSATSREIAIKRADLYVQARQFALTTGLSAENFLINYHAGMAERSLNAAKYVVDVGIALFNAQVEAQNLRLRTYEAAARVYETRIRAALANAELFKTQIEAASLRVQINRETIDLYRAQIDGVQSVINIYRTEMEAASIQSGIERIRLEAFREQVGAYTAQVRAKAEEFGMYEAAIRGEVARVEAFKSQVQAYGTQVDAARTMVQLRQAQVETDIARGKFALDSHNQQLVRYREVLSGQIATIKVQLEKLGIDTDIWTKTNAFEIDHEKLKVAAYQASQSHQKDQFNYYMDWAKTALNALVEEGQLQLKAAESGVSMYQNIVAGAMSSLNMLASIAE